MKTKILITIWLWTLTSKETPVQDRALTLWTEFAVVAIQLTFSTTLPPNHALDAPKEPISVKFITNASWSALSLLTIVLEVGIKMSTSFASVPKLCHSGTVTNVSTVSSPNILTLRLWHANRVPKTNIFRSKAVLASPITVLIQPTISTPCSLSVDAHLVLLTNFKTLVEIALINISLIPYSESVLNVLQAAPSILTTISASAMTKSKDIHQCPINVNVLMKPQSKVKMENALLVRAIMMQPTEDVLTVLLGPICLWTRSLKCALAL